MSEAQTGWIGLGAMGAPMAAHLAAAGRLAGVWNRTATKAAAFAAEHGVDAAASAGDLAAGCGRLVICVAADRDLLEVIEAVADRLPAGAVVIDHSTVAPAAARRAAEQLAARDIGFLDAPVSGGVEGARKGALSVMVGGDEQRLADSRPWLDCYAARVTHLGAAGSGQAAKAVNQVLVAGIAEAVCEGLALAEHLGLPPERLLSLLESGAAGNWFLEHRGRSMLADRFDEGFKLSLLVKDLEICHRVADESSARLPLTEMALADYRRCLERGDGDKDISALIRLKRERD